MEYKTSYFENEIREGFFIPGMVKRSWATQLDLLNLVDEICKKYDINWYADCGTLIGAIRHGGFIPWDDDLDICMLRYDYIRFNEVVRKELPEGYRVLNLANEETYGNYITRITNGEEICVNGEYLMEHNGFPYVAGIDIFPLDYLYPDDAKEEERRLKARAIWELAQRIQDGEDQREKAEILKEVEEILGHGVKPSTLPTVAILLRVIEELFQEAPSEGATHVALMPFWSRYANHKYPIAYYKDYVLMPFEMQTIRVPAAYGKVLEIEYGNWEVVNRRGGIHDYPFYLDQQEILFKNQGSVPYLYQLEEKDLEHPLRQEHAASCDVNRQRLEVMEKARELIVASLEKKDINSALALLGKSQELAISIGKDVDQSWGEGTRTVAELETYCEVLYQLYEKLTSGESVNCHQEGKRLNKMLRTAKARYQEEAEDFADILFMPARWCNWDSMRAFYEEECRKNGNRVKLMPIPYYSRGNDGAVQEGFYEGTAFSNEYEIVDYRSFDFGLKHPAKIYIQEPWDEYASAMTVDATYYASNLKNCTEHLIYIPYLSVDEIDPLDEKAVANLSLYAVTPGVVCADEVYVPSENTRNYYIDALGGSANKIQQSVWEKKIRVCPYQKKGHPLSGENILAFYTSFSDYYTQGKQVLEKLLTVFETFREKREVIKVHWIMEDTFEPELRRVKPELYEDFCRLKEEFIEQGCGSVVNVKNLEEMKAAVMEAKVYYGSKGYAMNVAVRNKKPVMIWKL